MPTMYTIQVSLCDIRYREVLYCTPRKPCLIYRYGAGLKYRWHDFSTLVYISNLVETSLEGNKSIRDHEFVMPSLKHV